MNWCKKLLDNDYIVYGLDLKKSKINHKNFIYYKDTVFNYSLVNRIIKKSHIVCHFAGIAEPMKYLTKTSEVIDLTINPSINIINECSKQKKKIYFTSTSEVYGNLKKKFSENDDRLLGATTYSRWCYSTAKALAEHYIIAKAKEKNLDYIIFRLFNVYGSNLKGRVVDNFINKALNNKNLQINGNGRQTRCFLYIDDCMDAFYRIFSNNISREIFNIGEDHEITILNFAKKIIKLTNSKSKIIVNSKQLNKFKGYQDILKRVPNVSKLKKMTNWKPRFNLDQGLMATIEKVMK